MLSARLPKSATADGGQAVLMLFIRAKPKHALSSLPCPPHLILEGRRGLRPLHLLTLRCAQTDRDFFSEN